MKNPAIVPDISIGVRFIDPSFIARMTSGFFCNAARTVSLRVVGIVPELVKIHYMILKLTSAKVNSIKTISYRSLPNMIHVSPSG